MSEGIEDKAELKLVVVLFRHGDRTPDASIGEIYETDPDLDPKDNYFPVGPGGLTNTGKLREYNLGRALRTRYDEFLDSIYYPALLRARSTDYERTKMSLQLVLHGLFPPAPNQQWKKGVEWQPIPTEYFRKEEDWLLRPDLHPKAKAATERYQESQEYLDLIAEQKELGKYLEEVTGKVYDNVVDMAMLYVTLSKDAAAGKELPEWSKDIFPDGQLLKAATFYFDLQNGNEEIRRLYGGMLLRKITDNFKSCQDGTMEEGRKLYLYSAHDTNVAALLCTLGIWKSHMPAFSSAVIVELLEHDGEYYVKLVRWLGIPATFVEVAVPGCDSMLCPLNEFLDLMKNVIASDDDIKST